MKKIAVTVAVLALGLAACQSKNEDNAVGNEANVENAAEADTAAATNDAESAADNLLDEAHNTVDAGLNGVENASESVANAAGNAID
jgi:hypothetical protein